MNPLAEGAAQLIGNLLGALSEALTRAAANVQWRNTARLRPVRPTWRRLWIRYAGRCSTCGQRFSAPACSLNRELGWSGHTVAGGCGAA